MAPTPETKLKCLLIHKPFKNIPRCDMQTCFTPHKFPTREGQKQFLAFNNCKYMIPIKGYLSEGISFISMNE
jgi:hypothetical protein